MRGLFTWPLPRSGFSQHEDCVPRTVSRGSVGGEAGEKHGFCSPACPPPMAAQPTGSKGRDTDPLSVGEVEKYLGPCCKSARLDIQILHSRSSTKAYSSFQDKWWSMAPSFPRLIWPKKTSSSVVHLSGLSEPSFTLITECHGTAKAA